MIKVRTQFLINGRVDTNGIVIDAYSDDGSRLKQFIGKKLNDIIHKMNVEANKRT